MKAVQGIKGPAGSLVLQLEDRAAAAARGAFPPHVAARCRCSVEISPLINCQTGQRHSPVLSAGEGVNPFIGLRLRRLASDECQPKYNRQRQRRRAQVAYPIRNRTLFPPRHNDSPLSNNSRRLKEMLCSHNVGAEQLTTGYRLLATDYFFAGVYSQMTPLSCVPPREAVP